MTFAYDYPLLGVFWTTLWFFLFIAWLMVLFRVFADIFRSHDMGGFAKTLWVLFVLFVPFLGVLMYLLIRGHKMSEHALADAQAQQAAFRAYVQESAGSVAPADQIERLVALRDAGKITPEDFEAAKAKILA